MRNIRLENVELKEAPIPYLLKNVENVTFENVTINGRRMDRNPAATNDTVLKLKTD